MDVLGPPPIGATMAARLYPPMLSITSRGADATGADIDARPALDQALYDAVTSGIAVAWLPMGTYRLKTSYNPTDRTVDHPLRKLDKYLSGFSWFGGWGKIGYPPSGGSGRYYAGPELVWYGADEGVMWELDSAIGCAITGVGFRGRPSAGTANRAGVGVNISQRGVLVGSGVHLLDRLWFNDLDVAVKFGDGQTTGAGNCDTTTFRDCAFVSCTTGVLLTHQQNLVYNFDGTSGFVACKTVVRSLAGGYLGISDLNANGCGGLGTDDWMLDLAGGRNVGTHKIARARIEGGCKQLLRVNSRYTEVIFEGLTEAQEAQGCTMFDVTGGQVTLLGGKLSTHDAAAPTFKLHQASDSGGSPSVRLYGVRFDTARFIYEEWFSHDSNCFPQITVRDCEDQFGRHIPSFSTRLESQLPVPLRAVTVNGTNNVPCTLLANGDANRSDNSCGIIEGAYRIRMTLIAVYGSGGVDQLQVRAVREADVVNDGTTLTMSTPEVIGTDYNPDGLVFSMVAVNSFKYIHAVVRGKAATTIQWRAEFTLVGGLNYLTLEG